ncbi:hypothetical protein C8250_042660 [Streptomyces sp. So13.3]|uniref:hypothetical protein n=1 Tax=Streptomyces TaxID=1883 RepID=UPI001107528B|nr:MULTISPECIES: hypothetical protein [Streptomyces]QNA77585.1 hypothetical protein C8250_042660 [Streptomyces sp. So13.3]
MRTVSDFVPLLGAPVRQEEGHLIEKIARSWSVTLPEDFVEVAGAYGDAAISEFIFLCGARTLQSYSDGMGRKLEQSSSVPHLVLPSADGALVWGNTSEGDQLFLVPRGGSTWTVSAFRRGWGDWYDSDLGFSDWFHLALTGGIAADWLPEWEPLPHPLELVD